MHAILELNVNGDRRRAGIPAHFTLLEALRYAFGLTGSKQGCDKGDCGACTVLIDGAPVLACITPAWEAEHHRVTTIEGVAAPGRLHPLQEAFEITGGAQCGFCTPGMLMSAYALIAHNAAPSRDEIRDALSGNLCRCTGYTKIYEAVELAARLQRGEPAAPVLPQQPHAEPVAVPAAPRAPRPNPMPPGQREPRIPLEPVTEE